MTILKTALKCATWVAYLGLPCGVLYSFGGLVVDLLTIGLNLSTALAFAAPLGMPALFGVIGFLGGALIAVVSRGLGPPQDTTLVGEIVYLHRRSPSRTHVEGGW